MIKIPAGFDYISLVSDLITAASPFLAVMTVICVYLVYKKAINRI